MKRLLATLISICSIAAFGAWEKAATIRVGEPEVIMMTVGHIGNHIGNPMIGMMAAAMIKDVPKGCIIYCDGSEIEVAVVERSAEEGKKWKISSENEEVKALAEKDIDSVLASTGTQAVVFDLESAGLASLCKEGEQALAVLSGDDLAAAGQLIAICKSISHATLGVEVDENGVVLKASATYQVGSVIEKLLGGKIPADAWEKVDPKALVTILSACNTGSKEDQNRAVQFVGEVFAKFGLDKFLMIKPVEPGYANITIDFAAILAETKNENSKFRNFDVNAFIEEIKKFPIDEDSKKLVKDKNDPSGCGIVIKGWTPAATPKARFEATLPEVKGKAIGSAGVGSIYSFMLAIKPYALAEMPAERRQLIEPILKMLPAEGVGGIAYASYCEGNEAVGIVRISEAEIKGIAAVVTAIAALEGSEESDVDCDDEDDEDDEEE